MSDASYYELALGILEAGGYVFIQPPPMNELTGFAVEPSLVKWGDKGVVIRHVCGWELCVVTEPAVAALDLLQVMQTHLLMRECDSCEKGEQP